MTGAVSFLLHLILTFFFYLCNAGDAGSPPAELYFLVRCNMPGRCSSPSDTTC